MKLLKDSGRLNANLEERLLKYYNEQECYAQYILLKKKGTRGICGSTSSEQNPSSVLVHLNGWEFTWNQYNKIPHTFVKDLFNRQRKHVNKWNETLYITREFNCWKLLNNVLVKMETQDYLKKLQKCCVLLL